MKRLLPLLLPCAALAHEVAHPRHEVLRISRAGVTLLVDYEVAAGEQARALRRAFAGRGALAEHLARSATLRTELLLDGKRADLQRKAVRGEKLDEPDSSSSLLAVRVELFAPWTGEPGWRGHRRLELRDQDETGHVPAAAECIDCSVSDASSGLPDRNLVRGANTPLEMRVRF